MAKKHSEPREGFFRRRATKFKKRAVEALAPASIRDTLPRMDMVRRAMKPAVRDQKAEQQMAADFERVLVQWGVTKAQLPRVIKGLFNEAVMYTLVGAVVLALGFWGFANSDILWGFTAFVWAAAMAAVVATRLWRRSVLNNRHYVPFGEWIGLPRRGQG